MRLRILLLTTILGALLAHGPAGTAQAKVRVFACEPDWGALAQEIGGDEVSIYSATTAFQDPHQIQARPSLIARLRNADLLFCSGAELEIGWLPVLMVQSANGGIQPGAPGYLMAADYVHLLEVPVAADRALGDVHPMGNPHIQTGAQNYIPVAKKLAERLSILDPAHTDQYQARLKRFTERWEAAMKKWEQEAAPLKGVPVLVHHMGWSYLFDWLGIQQVGTLEPKPGVPPSEQHLNQLLVQLRFQPAKMVIRAPFDDPRASDFMAEHVHIPELVLPFSVGGTAQAQDLFGVFDDTLARLLEGLKGQSDTKIAQR